VTFIKEQVCKQKKALGRYTENHTMEYESTMYFGFQEVDVASYRIMLYVIDLKINDR